MPISRRRFLWAAAASATASALGCNDASGTTRIVGLDSEGARIKARVRTPTKRVDPGMLPLDLGIARDGRLYVPKGYTPDRAFPLLVLLHGAGGSSASWFGSYAERADEAELVLLVIDSRRSTWDVVLGSFGPDIDFIDRALAATFGRCAIDPARLAVGGFSDGASYALSLGLANGDLFSRVIAYSPGFIAPVLHHGMPRFFVSHGTRDPVLDIDQCSRKFVPALRKAGYTVDYTEFDGEHEVPSAISAKAMRWLTTR